MVGEWVGGSVVGEVTEGGKRYRQLERGCSSSSSKPSSVASQRLSFGGQQGTRNGTAQPRVTFTGLCDNPIFFPRQHSLASDRGKKTITLFLWSKSGKHVVPQR